MSPGETIALVLFAAIGASAIAGAGIACVAVLWRGPEDTPAVSVLRAVNRVYVALVHGMWRTRREDPLPHDGPCIVVANHRSSVDPHIVCAVTWRWIHFLMAREYYEIRGLTWFFSVLRAVPVRRDGRDLSATRTALKTLRSGKVIGIFPQGGIREADDPLAVGKAGAALLALRTGAPVLPLYIEGGPSTTSVFGALFRPSRARVRAGDSIRFEPRGRKPTREEIEETAEAILRAITLLRCEKQATPRAAGHSGASG